MMVKAIQFVVLGLPSINVEAGPVRALPTVEEVRQAFKHLCQETRCGSHSSFAWSNDESSVYFLDQRDFGRVALRKCDVVASTWSTVFDDFRSRLGRLAVSSDDWWAVAWDQGGITIGSLINDMKSEIRGRFMPGGCLTPDSKHLIVWGCPSESKAADIALLSVSLAFGPASYTVLFAPTQAIRPPAEGLSQVEVSGNGNRLLWGYRVASGENDFESVMLLSELVNGALLNTIQMQMPPSSSDWTIKFLGARHLICVASDVNKRFTSIIFTLDLSAALADGKVSAHEWTLLGPKFPRSRATLSFDPLGDFVSCNRYGFQRRQRTSTGVFRLADCERLAHIDAGWDTANVSWSPRGSFCISVVGTQQRAGESIKVLTRVAVEKLLEESRRGAAD